MQLQAAVPSILDDVHVPSTVDSPTVVLKDVRAEAASRLTLSAVRVDVMHEETIVPDQRAGVSPAQAVERKLSALLPGGAAIAVSHFRLAKLCGKG